MKTFITAVLIAIAAAYATQPRAQFIGGITVGRAQFSSGSVTAPSVVWRASPTSGWYSDANNSGAWTYAASGAPRAGVGPVSSGGAIYVFQNAAGISSGLIWSDSVSPYLVFRGALVLDAATDTYAFRNGVSAQTLRVYNTTDASITNYERGYFAWAGNTLSIGTEFGGTGAARGINIQTGGATRLQITGGQNALRYIGFTFANIGTHMVNNGDVGYCSDCTIANPCAGAGTGAIAKRLNGVNVCN